MHSNNQNCSVSNDGNGRRPTLVFIHGFLDGAAVWNEVMAALGEWAADALCVDLPGMGERADEDGPYSLDRFADDVAARVSALNRPVILIGHSMGAQIAELAAGRLGEQVRAVALLTPVPLRGTALPDEVMQTFHALGGNPAAQRALRRQFSFNLDDAGIEKLGRLGDRVKAASVGVFADIWNNGHPAGAQRTQCNGPVLIVRGAGDVFVTDELISGSVAPHFDNPTVVVVDQAGHWLQVEQPESVAAVLTSFLATVDQPEESGVKQQGWTSAFEQKSANAFADAFASDIVLEASALTKPIVGADQVKAVMEAASSIYEALSFTHEAINGRRNYLEWEAQAFGGERLSGITILTKNEDGKIARVAIHHRPLGGMLKFSATLGQRLQGRIDVSFFYSVN